MDDLVAIFDRYDRFDDNRFDEDDYSQCDEMPGHKYNSIKRNAKKLARLAKLKKIYREINAKTSDTGKSGKF